MTKQQVTHEFRLYFADLQAELNREGAKADRKTEWQNFIQAKIEDGEIPAAAADWTI